MTKENEREQKKKRNNNNGQRPSRRVGSRGGFPPPFFFLPEMNRKKATLMRFLRVFFLSLSLYWGEIKRQRKDERWLFNDNFCYFREKELNNDVRPVPLTEHSLLPTNKSLQSDLIKRIVTREKKRSDPVGRLII